MKFLTICQYGHSRSVALARGLQARGHAAVAIGAMTSADAIEVLGGWADRIVLMAVEFRNFVPSEFQNKLMICDIGPDRWSNPYHPELMKILNERIPNLER